MEAVILEDDLIIADHLSDILRSVGIESVKVVDNLDDARDCFKAPPDFCFVDIRIGESNGIEFGRDLNEQGIPFVYITANNEYKVLKEAIATNPVTYITKPFNQRDVVAAVELIRLKYASQKKISILGKSGSELLHENSITYCKADGVYSEIYTGGRSITQRITLKELSLKLSSDFVRIHRSYIVNVSKITSRKGGFVYLEDTKLPVSRSYKDELDNLFKEG